MKEQNAFKAILIPTEAVATNATQEAVWDTKGWDYANIYIMQSTHATDAESITTLQLEEHDTSTAVSNHAAIAAFTGGTATSSTVGFVIPGAATMGAGGGIVEFQVDLRKRKRYMSISITPGETTTCNITGLVLLSRGRESADSTTDKASVNYGINTNSQGVTVVSG